MIGIQIEHKNITARMIQNDLFNKHQVIIECGGRAGSVLRLLCSLEIHQTDLEYFFTALDNTLQDLEREYCHVY